MTLYQVTARYLVFVDRTTEVEAESVEAAIAAERAYEGEIVEEQPQDTYSREHAIKVCDENGNVVWENGRPVA